MAVKKVADHYWNHFVWITVIICETRHLTVHRHWHVFVLGFATWRWSEWEESPDFVSYTREKKRRWEEKEEKLSHCRWSVSSIQTAKYKPVLFLSPACCSDDEILTSSSTETSWINISFHTESVGRGHFFLISLNHILSYTVWTVWCSRCFSLLKIFLALERGEHSAAQRKREREREWWLSEGERESQISPGRHCVRSGALGPFGWLTLNGCPGEVTRLIENRLRGEGNAFAPRLAPWPTVQRLPWQLWNPTYLFATLWRERVERLSE